MSHSTAFAALIWWVIPLIGVSGAIGYVIWTSKYKDKFDNETNRSVSKFQLFQETLREPSNQVQAAGSAGSGGNLRSLGGHEGQAEQQ